MAVQYDPKVIQEFAEKLYKEADSVVTAAAIRWGLVAGLVGAVAGGALIQGSTGWAIGGIGGIVAGALIGSATAASQASLLRLQAQQALCQMQIEANTRHGGVPTPP